MSLLYSCEKLKLSSYFFPSTTNYKKFLLLLKLATIGLFLIYATFLALGLTSTTNTVMLAMTRRDIPDKKLTTHAHHQHHRLPSSSRVVEGLSIAIVTVVQNSSQLDNDYKTAISTLRCYAGVQNYPLHILYLQAEPEQRQSKCQVEDVEEQTKFIEWEENLFFRRHCAVSEFMSDHPQYDYVLFLDADIGVINPQRRIEEFIDVEANEGGEAAEMADLIFYNRESIWEIAACAYLARNTDKARRFISYLWKIGWELPKRTNITIEHLRRSIFANYDNGALHQVFMDLFAKPDEIEKCAKFYRRHNDDLMWDNMIIYEECVNIVLTNRTSRSDVPLYYRNTSVGGLVKLLPTYKSWVRDSTAWFAESWNIDHDFMLHGWKEQRKDLPGESDDEERQQYRVWNHHWTDPFVGEEPPPFLASNHCVPEHKEEVFERFWRARWRKELMVGKGEFDAIVEAHRQRVQVRIDSRLQEILILIDTPPSLQSQSN